VNHRTKAALKIICCSAVAFGKAGGLTSLTVSSELEQKRDVFTATQRNRIVVY